MPAHAQLEPRFKRALIAAMLGAFGLGAGFDIAQACPGACLSGASSIVQFGSPNSATVTQNGLADYSGVYQGGSSNQAFVNQGVMNVQGLGFAPPSNAVQVFNLAAYAPSQPDEGARLIEARSDGPDVSAADTAGMPCSGTTLKKAALDDNTPLHICDEEAGDAHRPMVLQIYPDLRGAIDVAVIEIADDDIDVPGEASPEPLIFTLAQR